jgi:hypothetical protein
VLRIGSLIRIAETIDLTEQSQPAIAFSFRRRCAFSGEAKLTSEGLVGAAFILAGILCFAIALAISF